MSELKKEVIIYYNEDYMTLRCQVVYKKEDDSFNSFNTIQSPLFDVDNNPGEFRKRLNKIAIEAYNHSIKQGWQYSQEDFNFDFSKLVCVSL